MWFYLYIQAQIGDNYSMTKHQPHFERVRDYLLEGITNGSWRAGERVPSENELVDLCNVSRMTARRGLQELLLDGTLVRRKGVGSFVSSDKQQHSRMPILPIAVEIRESGHQHSAKPIEIVLKKADEKIAAIFGVDIGEPIYYSQVLHYQDERPIQLECRWVLPNAAPKYIEQNFINETPGEYLTNIAPVTKAKHKIEAIIGDKEIRRKLDVDSNEAILQLNRTTWCGAQLVSFAQLYHPGNSYQMGTEFGNESSTKD